MRKNYILELRKGINKTQSTVANKVGIKMGELVDIENNLEDNLLINNSELEEKFSKYFKVEKKILYTDPNPSKTLSDDVNSNKSKRKKVLFIDTSVFLNSLNIEKDVEMYMEKFHALKVTQTVREELNNVKDKDTDGKFKLARNAISLLNDKIKVLNYADMGSSNDSKIMAGINKYASENKEEDVYFLTGDKDFSAHPKSPLIKGIFSKSEYNSIWQDSILVFDVDEVKQEKFINLIKNDKYKELIDFDYKGVNINGVIDNMSCLSYAVDKGFIETVKYLMKKKYINVNCEPGGEFGYSALHYAVSNNNYEMVKMLLDKGANINIKSKYGRVTKTTPLMIAADKGLSIICELLLERNASVNVQDSNGCTALHRAAIKNKKNVYNVLKHRCDNRIVCDNYKTADEYL